MTLSYNLQTSLFRQNRLSMENHPLSDLSSQHCCRSPSTPLVKINIDKPLFPNEAQQQLVEDKKVGESFFKQGELRLLHGDISGIQFFDLALQLDSTNYRLYYNQGLSLLEFSSHRGNEKTLLLASKRFKSAVKLQPSFFEGWHAFGNALFLLGKTTEEHHYFLEAQKKYKKALSICKGQADDILADLYHSFGSVCQKIAERSKEPSDFIEAIEAYEKALSYQEIQTTDFWHEYGFANLHLASRLNDLRYFNQGIFCFKNGVSLSISSFDSWHHLANALKTLYNFTHDEDHYTQANECYATAAHLNSKDVNLWTNWATLLKDSGILIKDVKRLYAAVEKCHKAHCAQDLHIPSLCIWIEALSYLGLLTDKVSLIHDAHNKVIMLAQEQTSPDILHAYGINLFCFGKYYNDLDYYYQAIEKFQEGLSLDRTLHKLWHSLAYSYTRAALIDEDETDCFDKAHRFYQKAIALQGNSLYYYNYGYSLYKFGELHQNEQALKIASEYFEMALYLQKDAVYLHPDWLFYYGLTLDQLAGFNDDIQLYTQSLELLNHVLIIDPEHPKVHYNLALVYTHYAEISSEALAYQKALYHYKLAFKKEEENDQLILDWAISLASYGDFVENMQDKLYFLKEAEFKMMQSAKLGNIHAYYHLACIYSLLNEPVKSLYFLKKAEIFDALPTVDELFEDDWLENLRKTEFFQDFLSYLETKSSQDN